MKLYQFLTKRRDLITLFQMAARIIAPIYIFAMVLYPYIHSGFNWQYVQDVWQTWQTFNAGLLAFFASIVAITIAQMNTKENERRSRTASLAFLESALLELSSYCSSCMREYQNILRTTENSYGTYTLPNLPIPTSHREVFSECIKYSNRSVQIGLSKILSDLQKLRSYMELQREFRSGMITSCKIMAYTEVGILVLLLAKINAMYPIARSEEEQLTIPISKYRIDDAIRALDISLSDTFLARSIIKRSVEDELFLEYVIPQDSK